jgi:hypothetical protein
MVTCRELSAGQDTNGEVFGVAPLDLPQGPYATCIGVQQQAKQP